MYWHYGTRVLMDAEGFIVAADYIVEHGQLQDIHHLYYSVPILSWPLLGRCFRVK